MHDQIDTFVCGRKRASSRIDLFLLGVLTQRVIGRNRRFSVCTSIVMEIRVAKI
jgi:hypothetical protein